MTNDPNNNDRAAAKAMVDALEIDASPEGIVIAFQEECARRCPAHAPAFLDRLSIASNAMFD